VQGVSRYVLEPRLQMLWQATDAVAFKAAGGRFAQFPSLPVGVAGFEAFGLADLGLQTAVGGSLGAEAQLPRALTLGVTGYYQHLRLTDVRVIDLTTVDPAAPDFLVSRPGRAYGAELMVRRADQGRFYGWLAYTLSWSQRQDENGVYGRSDWDQRHILNLVAGRRFDGGWTAGARFHFNSGRPVPIINTGGSYQELPPFYQLDLRVERRVLFDRFLLDVFADFANVTLTRQVLQLSYGYDASAGMPRIEEQAFRLVLPTVGVHGEF
jgi:hypothetical protein